MRHSLRAVVIVTLLGASAASAQECPPIAAGSLSEYAAAWSSHDVERIASYFTEDASYEDVTLGETHHGRPAIKAFAQGTFAALPGFAIQQRSLLSAESWAAIEWEMTGTHRETGKNFSVRGVSVMELECGMIRRNSDYWDMAAFQRQIEATLQGPMSAGREPAGEAGAARAGSAADRRREHS